MNAPLLRSGSLLFVLLLLAVAALKADVLQQPPVWDTSTGLFPAAIVLAENGFDLRDLLAQPGWAQGGPNIHQFSSLTWLTAAVLWLVPERDAWLPLLHGLHFAMAAGVLLGLVRLAAPLLPELLRLGLAIVLLLYPLFQVQAGYLYTEIPLALATVWALVAASQRRFGRAAGLAALACSVKEAGLVVPVALAAAVVLERGPVAARVGRVAAFLLPAALFVGLQVGFSLPVEESFGARPLSYGAQLTDIARKLGIVPDLVLLLAGFAVAAALSLPGSLRALRGGDEADAAARVRGLLLLTVGAFTGFYLLVPLTGVEVYVLPRYYVQVAPLLLLSCADLAQRSGGPRACAGLLALLSFGFAANRSGELGIYPPVPGNEFSLAERSAEYRELFEAQRQLVAAANELPSELPVFYGLPQHFLFAYPRMGWAEAPLASGHCIWLDPRYRGAPLSAFPDRFAILYDFVGYGGRKLQQLVREARADPGWRVQVTPFEHGRYRTLLFELSRRGAAPPRP